MSRSLPKCVRYRSLTISHTSSSRFSTSVTPESLSPATPRDFSTMWQNWCVVAMVAASKPASASRSRR
ncbi:Uncharacterised protein [Mycobacteroides abscessus subsp. abscessus]|nr:Uncharacterised protein [Mycobacteroides abscessus subsp. abscessus]